MLVHETSAVGVDTPFLCKHFCCNNFARALARELKRYTSYETGEADGSGARF